MVFGTSDEEWLDDVISYSGSLFAVGCTGDDVLLAQLTLDGRLLFAGAIGSLRESEDGHVILPGSGCLYIVAWGSGH